MRFLFTALALSMTIIVPAQTAETALANFLKHNSVKHATVGISVLDENGNTIVENNSESSLAPASTQKLLTSITALELLGYDHKFVTTVSMQGSINEGTLLGNIIIKSGGDPVLGAEDFKGHYGEFVQSWINAIRKEGITKIEGRILINDSIFKGDRNSGSSALNDIGNYYGTGAPGFSFMDNEFTVYFDTQGNGSLSQVSSVEPQLPASVNLINQVKAGSVTGDNVIIYSLDGGSEVFLKGKLPPNKKSFKVRGAIPNVSDFAVQYITDKVNKAGIEVVGKIEKGPLFMNTKELIRTKSPALIEILKVMNKKSVNTYADVIFKHLGLSEGNEGSFNGGEKSLLEYWKAQNLDVDGVNLEDGSGLARRNNITASFMTGVLKSAMYNEQVNKILAESSNSGSIKSMWGTDPGSEVQAKSGYIGRVRAYSGYFLKGDVKSPFYITVNNYNGSNAEVRKQIGVLLKAIRNTLK